MIIFCRRPEIQLIYVLSVFLTFHSGEDRRVKQSMKEGLKAGLYTEISRCVVRAGQRRRVPTPAVGVVSCGGASDQGNKDQTMALPLDDYVVK
jgi:hypothetical protein